MGLNRKRRLSIILAASLMLALGTYLLCYSNKPRNLNILLITIDSLRPDHLGCYGYKRNTSPNIDKLAKEETLFTQTISQAPYTSASIASIMTSTYPDSHGVEEVYEYLDPQNTTLAEILRDNSYLTLAITSNFIISENRGFAQGFYETFNVNDKEATKIAVDWLERNKDHPLFLWIHYMAPHGSYKPPEPYHLMFKNDTHDRKIKVLRRISKDEYGFNGIPRYVLKDNIFDVNYYIAQYDGEIAFIDNEIKILLTKLDNLGISKKTLVIVTADHGEDLGEHGYYFSHGATLYDTSLRVPLIMRLPVLIPANIIINTQVCSIDIMPTILDILGIKINKKIEGHSLLPLILNKQKKKLVPYVFSYTQNKISIRAFDWKLIYDSNNKGYELYNLEKDAEELTNLVAMQKEQFKFLEVKLKRWMNHSKPKISHPKEPLDEQTKERLKSLGYLQ